ncbi:MAG: response regulator [Tannerellaceae bacterium]|nr:response regulator [Tannerellaceae bacterium]
MNPQTDNLKVYTKSNGLLSDQFNYNSGFKNSSGKLYFGNQEGLIAFNPKNFEENPYAPPVYITNFSLFNEQLKPSDDNSILQQSTTFGGRIDLSYQQSTFTFDFAALSYTASEKNQYAYMLEGFDTDWNYPTKYQQAYYSNIPPGKYTFKVNASNNDNLWSEEIAKMEVIIHPPFYKTTGAYLFYFILIISLILFIVYNLRKRGLAKIKRKQEIFENEKEKELYDTKIAFFTTIAHEIRTPLSLIKGPLEYIMKESVSEKEQKENLEIINKNTNRLQDLTNQFLDFRKTEKEGFKLNFIQTDINQLITGIYERFTLTASQKKIDFTLDLPEQLIFADIDREAVTKIISNLFNNALKYANSTISAIVYEDKDNEKLMIQIANDGYIIPEEYAEKIFEPFYQIKDKHPDTIPSGTGLGLSLSRSLASLHNGSLILEKYDPAFNRFLLTLPLYHPKAADAELKEESLEETGTDSQIQEEETGNSGHQSTVLLVEDDADMLLFLQNILKGRYNIQTAHNGQEALSILEKVQIDLIISDILMPVMDGLELCRKIKNMLSYSHTPIILLTAKTGIGASIKGLDAGADAYIEKPFSTEYLRAQISNLFSNREKLKVSFANSPFSKAGTMAASKADEEFLQKATDIIHKHLADENLNVDLLAEELGMSRSSLHRKIKGVSELTPNDFIVLVKLKKAAELLNNKTYRVNEVCYVVGFTSSSYFSKCFKKYFGLSPREFIKKEEINP